MTTSLLELTYHPKVWYINVAPAECTSWPASREQQLKGEGGKA